MRISDWSSDVCSSDLDRLSVIDAEVVYAVVSDMGADADVTPEPMAPSVLDDAEELADMPAAAPLAADPAVSEEVARSEEHTSELQSLMRISYAVFCLKKTKRNTTTY